MKEAFRLTETARHVLRQYGLEPDKLTNCSVRTYHFGEHIITEGIPNEYLFLVTAGRAKVGVSAPNGKNIILCFYISKGLMGEAELYARMATGSTTITVLETLTCIAIPVPVNRAYLDSNLAFTRMAAAALADKLLQRAGNVVENTLYTAQTRAVPVYSRRCRRRPLSGCHDGCGLFYRHQLPASIPHDGAALPRGDSGKRDVRLSHLRVGEVAGA